MMKLLFKEFISIHINRLLTIRHFLKLHFFKSPMQLNLSFKFEFKKIISKIAYLNKINELNDSYKSESNDFNKNGYSVFNNKLITKNCSNILDEINEIKNPWDINNNFCYAPPSKIFKKQLINIFKNGVDDFIKLSFKSDYYIFYHKLYKSERLKQSQIPEGSELWHADGGPGSCMNLMICHTDIDENNGAMKIIPWQKSKLLLSKLFFDYKKLFLSKFKNKEKDKLFLRELKCSILKNYIDDNAIDYFQPRSLNPGTIFAFRNNCVHAGGYTKFGYKRIVSVMHIYPTPKITSLEEKFSKSHLKIAGYPK